MKKLLVVFAAFVTVVILVFIFLLKFPRSFNVSNLGKPPIVDHFACSDYCPGPAEKYMVKVYKGVEDEEECLRLGGWPKTYIGWGTFRICIVK